MLMTHLADWALIGEVFALMWAGYALTEVAILALRKNRHGRR